jgi:23S rRNA pseudouridine1911/1915/1917 synthase
VSHKTRFAVLPDENGLRLDQVLPRHVPGLSRRKARSVIDIGGVFVDKSRVKVAGRPVRSGQIIEVNIGGALERANDTPLAPRIVHVDDHIIVVDKPAGLVTAPTPESNRGDLLDQLVQQFGEVYLVHRIDMPTSGLLVFARTRDANKRLGDAFKMHDVEREYRALAVGHVTAQTIDRPIDRRRAVTHVAPLETLSSATLLRATLETGRTHQIRIHLAGIGHPIAGDRTHGGETERAFLPRPPRLALHAAVLGFAHPATGERVRWESALPDDLAVFIDRLRKPASPSPSSSPSSSPSPDDIIDFWFGDGSPAVYQRWYTRDAAFDAEITRRFAALYAQASRGELDRLSAPSVDGAARSGGAGPFDRWKTTARGALALVIVLDQFPRNMFRDDPRAFATDAAALAITQDLIASGRIDELAPLQQLVAQMPLMHSESRDAQRESVARFTQLAASHPGDAMLASSADYARQHAKIVERFGRFPHRNATLGRASTPEEVEFLKQPGSSF